MLLKPFFLFGSDDFEFWLGRGLGRGRVGSVQFDEVVEIVERHVQCFFESLIGHESQVNEVLLHALALQLKELYFGNDGQVLALFNLVGDELALGGLEGLLLLVGLDALALHVVHKLRGYF